MNNNLSFFDFCLLNFPSDRLTFSTNEVWEFNKRFRERRFEERDGIALLILPPFKLFR